MNPVKIWHDPGLNHGQHLRTVRSPAVTGYYSSNGLSDPYPR